MLESTEWLGVTDQLVMSAVGADQLVMSAVCTEEGSGSVAACIPFWPCEHRKRGSTGLTDLHQCQARVKEKTSHRKTLPKPWNKDRLFTVLLSPVVQRRRALVCLACSGERMEWNLTAVLMMGERGEEADGRRQQRWGPQGQGSSKKVHNLIHKHCCDSESRCPGF